MNETFKSKVENCWKAFSEKEAEIRKMMDNKVEGEILLDFVNNILTIAFNKVYFEMGINGEDKYELILTPEGDRTRLLQLHYWQQQAPASLSEKWNFYSSKPGGATSGMSMSMFGVSVDKDDILIYYEANKDEQKINIQVVSPKLMTLEENQRYSMFFILLDQFIGETNVMLNIGYIDFVEEAPDLKSVSIDQFKSTISQIFQEEEWTQSSNPLDMYTGYRLEATEAEEWELREDIFIGMTSCTAIINAFLNKEEEMFNEYKEDGVTFGFLFYENVNVPSENMVHFRGEIEDKILEKAIPQGIADSIGGATGNYFSYMDFIIYDLDTFLKVAQDILSEYDMEETGFSNFVFGAEPVWFEK